jgi:hypothetical protein
MIHVERWTAIFPEFPTPTAFREAQTTELDVLPWLCDLHLHCLEVMSRDTVVGRDVRRLNGDGLFGLFTLLGQHYGVDPAHIAHAFVLRNFKSDVAASADPELRHLLLIEVPDDPDAPVRVQARESVRQVVGGDPIVAIDGMAPMAYPVWPLASSHFALSSDALSWANFLAPDAPYLLTIDEIRRVLTKGSECVIVTTQLGRRRFFRHADRTPEGPSFEVWRGFMDELRSICPEKFGTHF